MFLADITSAWGYYAFCLSDQTPRPCKLAEFLESNELPSQMDLPDEIRGQDNSFFHQLTSMFPFGIFIQKHHCSCRVWHAEACRCGNQTAHRKEQACPPKNKKSIWPEGSWNGTGRSFFLDTRGEEVNPRLSHSSSWPNDAVFWKTVWSNFILSSNLCANFSGWHLWWILQCVTALFFRKPPKKLGFVSRGIWNFLSSWAESWPDCIWQCSARPKGSSPLERFLFSFFFFFLYITLIHCKIRTNAIFFFDENKVICPFSSSEC